MNILKKRILEKLMIALLVTVLAMGCARKSSVPMSRTKAPSIRHCTNTLDFRVEQKGRKYEKIN